MARRTVEVTEADLLDALSAAAIPARPTRPPGFYTISELHAKSGTHPTMLRERMRRLESEGRVDKVTVYIERADGRMTPVMAYRLRAAA